jgi:iron complex transport system ATP-binding protein
MNPSILSTHNLELQIAGKTLCKNLCLELNEGQSLAVLGRNGTGKTTLLHTLLNFRSPVSGNVHICGENIQHVSRKKSAKNAGILFQNTSDDMPATVMELVMMGRYPHIEGWQWGENPEDSAKACEALVSMELDDLAARQTTTLSGGERQRLALAMLLAQSPRLYLLDEPSNHLDIGFQIKALNVLKDRIAAQSAALCMATHDINLAARFCEQILLFIGDGSFVYGSADMVLTEENLTSAYGCPISRVESGRQSVFFSA